MRTTAHALMIGKQVLLHLMLFLWCMTTFYAAFHHASTIPNSTPPID